MAGRFGSLSFSQTLSGPLDVSCANKRSSVDEFLKIFMIKLLRSLEIQVPDVGNFEIAYFPYKENNGENLTEFRCYYFGK